MINPTRIIEMTAALYKPQLMCSTDKHYNNDFYITRERLQKMYLIKYTRNYGNNTLHPFKAVML